MRYLDQIIHDNKRAILDPRIVGEIADHEQIERVQRIKEALEKHIEHNPSHRKILEALSDNP